jgi:glutathione synthase/RimK-type ligase-like ATP-grasp enzyme
LILIATNQRDLTADYVVLELQNQGLHYYRLNTETITKSSICFSPGAGKDGWSLKTADETIYFGQFTAGYYRRPEPPEISPSVAGEAEHRYCAEEWQEALNSALASLHNRWLNSPIAILDAENKSRQLSVAIRIGFDVPDTLITNDFDRASEFVAQAPSIGKPLRASLLAADVGERVIFTTRLSQISPDVAASIKVAPIIFQREIPKRCDVRVTVVGEQTFAAEINSQTNIETEVDWRRGDHIDLSHTIHPLPSAIQKKCVMITHAFNLRFSAIDLVLDPSGNYWFLELNPNGQWAWIEARTGLPISEAITNELVRISNEQNS